MFQKVSAVYAPQRMLNVKEFLNLPLYLCIPAFQLGPVQTSQKFNIYFNPSRTTINKATLQWSASPTLNWMALHVELDGARVVDEQWTWNTESRSGFVDITGPIKNVATHEFIVTVYKNPYVGYAFECCMSTGLKVIIDWTGDEPSVTPITGPEWMGYAKWALAIAGVGIAGLIVVKGVEAYKKK